MRPGLLVVFLFGCGRTAIYEPAEPGLDGAVFDAGSRDAGLHDAGVRDAGLDAGPPESPWICETADAGPPSANACERDVTAGVILPNNPGCFVDVVPTQGETGKLRWDCGSD